MMLRHLVAGWLRQAAREKVQEAVLQAARQSRERPARSAASDDQEAPPEAIPCRIVLVFALGVESGGFVDLLSEVVTTKGASFLEHSGQLGPQRVALIESGVGSQAAARATRDAIAIHHPAWIISAGFAGALSPDLRRGHILMASHLADTAGRKLEVGLHFDRASLEGTPSLHTGRLLTVDRLVRTSAEKKQLHDKYEAVACDMETMAVAQVCSSEKVRFLSVRIISDAVDDELPKEIERLLDQKSLAGKLGAATGAIFGRPSSIKDMWRLKEDALRASDRLARFLVGIVKEIDT